MWYLENANSHYLYNFSFNSRRAGVFFSCFVIKYSYPFFKVCLIGQFPLLYLKCLFIKSFLFKSNYTFHSCFERVWSCLNAQVMSSIQISSEWVSGRGNKDPRRLPRKIPFLSKYHSTKGKFLLILLSFILFLLFIVKF